MFYFKVGVSAIFGVCGSIIFPTLRKKVGVNRTGTIGFACLISVLTLSAISVGLPGTLFEPGSLFQSSNYQKTSNGTNFILNSSLFTEFFPSSNNTSNMSSFIHPEDSNATIPPASLNTTSHTLNCATTSYVSIGFFLTGVVGARFGLWIADLSINQILQEEVSDENRGKISGVQSGLNAFMNTLKYLLVSIVHFNFSF